MFHGFGGLMPGRYSLQRNLMWPPSTYPNFPSYFSLSEIDRPICSMYGHPEGNYCKYCIPNEHLGVYSATYRGLSLHATGMSIPMVRVVTIGSKWMTLGVVSCWGEISQLTNNRESITSSIKNPLRKPFKPPSSTLRNTGVVQTTLGCPRKLVNGLEVACNPNVPYL